MEHDLKIGKEYLERLISGNKKAEIRYNDRDYQVSDILVFTKYGVRVEVFKFQVTHIHSGLGMAEGYICLSVIEE